MAVGSPEHRYTVLHNRNAVLSQLRFKKLQAGSQKSLELT